MKALIDFLNHGILPFGGRHREIGALINFCKGTIETQELRAGLLIGETGSGKSRLIEELGYRLADQPEVLIHARVFPESDHSITSLTARSLWYAEEARRLLQGPPEDEMGSVVENIRKLSRLRPTLLVIEDLHLLSGEAVREFSMLLNGLAEETLSILCVTRPVDLPARPSLERYLIEEINLGGLSPADTEHIWSTLFKASPDGSVLTALHEETGGNPLALRSALRWAVKSGCLQEESEGRWSLTVSDKRFRQGLRQSTRMLADGMIAHLKEEEKEVAVRLAPLGEAIARETAQRMLGEENRLLERLIYKGVLSHSPTPLATLPGEETDYPLLMFTHTLLHDYLIEAKSASPVLLLEIIAEDSPLYSYHPFFLPTLREEVGQSPPSVLIRGLRRMMKVVQHLDRSPDWKRAEELWELAEQLFRAGENRLPEKERAAIEIEIATWRLAIMRREVKSTRFRELVDDYDRMIERLGENSPPHYRLAARLFRHRNLFMTDYSACLELWRGTDRFLAEFPELREADFYVSYLNDMAQAAGRESDNETLKQIEREWRRLIADPDIAEDRRKELYRRVGPHFLPHFNSEEELEERTRLLDELNRQSSEDDPTFLLRKLTFLYNTGRMEEAVRVARKGIRRFTGIEPVTTFQCEVIHLCALLATGQSPEQVEEDLLSKYRSAPDSLSARFGQLAAIYFAEMGMLRGEPAWTSALVHRIFPEAEEYWPEITLLNALEQAEDSSDITGILATLPDESNRERLLCDLVRRLDPASGNEKEKQSVRDDLRSYLQQPILQIDDLLTLHAVVALAGRTADHDLQNDLADCIDRGIAWLAERSLAALAFPLLERGKQLFSRKQATLRRGTLRSLSEDRKLHREAHRFGLSMLGKITVSVQESRPQNIRGGRQKTLLGLLVAAEMTSTPLSNIEFCRIASGGESDIDLARKTTNMAVLRLREGFGEELIETGEERHRLNETMVRVDLLEAWRELQTARAALRRRNLIRAVPAVTRALELLGSDVPFPGLYDDFFEALREDVETTFRSVLIDVAATLLHEGDPATGTEILQSGLQRLPEDEEMADLLEECLRSLESRTEAVRLRLSADTSPI